MTDVELWLVGRWSVGWENRAEVLIVSQFNKWSSLESVANVVSSKKKKKPIIDCQKQPLYSVPHVLIHASRF